jgi:hypothetical protein
METTRPSLNPRVRRANQRLALLLGAVAVGLFVLFIVLNLT